MSVQHCRVGVRPLTYWIIQCFTALHYNISRIRFILFFFLPGNLSFVVVPDPKVPGGSTKNTPSHNHQPSAQAINVTQTKTFIGVFVEPRSTFHLKFDFGWRGFSEESQLTWNPPYLRRYGKERKLNSIWKRVCVGFGKESPGLASGAFRFQHSLVFCKRDPWQNLLFSTVTFKDDPVGGGSKQLNSCPGPSSHTHCAFYRIKHLLYNTPHHQAQPKHWAKRFEELMIGW